MSEILTMKPLTIPGNIRKYRKNEIEIEQLIKEIRNEYPKLFKGDPDITISIPAFNEEKSILHTLHSICQNKTNYSVEIIVINNNSTDRTEELVRSCGIPCFSEIRQGITFARNRGLTNAKGRFVINADADTIYPNYWIQEIMKPFETDKNIALTYGGFSFIPIGNTPRVIYFFYEYLADLSRKYNKHFKDEAVNVYGFNSAFRKEFALKVDGFNHPPGSNEDGYLALKIRESGFGKLFYAKKALVWTTDRRIHIDGGLWAAMLKRLKRIVGKAAPSNGTASG